MIQLLPDKNVLAGQLKQNAFVLSYDSQHFLSLCAIIYVSAITKIKKIEFYTAFIGLSSLLFYTLYSNWYYIQFYFTVL